MSFKFIHVIKSISLFSYYNCFILVIHGQNFTGYGLCLFGKNEPILKMPIFRQKIRLQALLFRQKQMIVKIPIFMQNVRL